MIFQLNQNLNELTCGLIYFLMCAPQTPLYILVILSVLAKNRKESNITYKIINIINFSQFGQSLGQLITSTLLLFPILQTEGETVFRVIGCLMITFYQAESPTMALLASSRLLIFMNVLRSDKWHIVIKAYFIFGILALLAIFTIFTWTSNWIFIPPSFSFDLDVPNAQFFSDFSFYMSICCMLTSYFCYTSITLLIYVRKKATMSASSRREEIAIMSQYSFITVYGTCTMIFWNKAGGWVDMESFRVRAAINVGWIVGIYLNPVLLLIFNRLIRNEFLQIIGVSRKATGSRTVPSLASRTTPDTHHKTLH